MGQIIELPEIQRLREAIEALRQRLTDRVCARDELVFTVCKNIKTQYLLEFGAEEYKLYEGCCNYYRLRRKRDLLQAKINRQEEISLEAIEEQLDLEFQDYQRRLDEYLSEMNEAIKRSQARVLSPEEQKELKALYRRIVKALHPDLHEHLTPAQRELFIRATLAYKDGDLATIRLISELIAADETDEMILTLPSLEEEKARLEQLIEEVEAEMRRVKEAPPYTWRVYLVNEAEKRKKHELLNVKLQSYLEAARTLEEKIEWLLEVQG